MSIKIDSNKMTALKEWIMENKFRNPIQIGIITDDLDKSIAYFKSILGIEPRAIADFPPEGYEDVYQEYKGKKGNSSGKFCFFDFGNIEIEIIYPVSGESVWKDFLDEHGPGLHHIKFSVAEHDESRAHLKKLGYDVYQGGAAVGKNAGKEWVYYNTFSELGFDLEVMNEHIKK